MAMINLYIEWTRYIANVGFDLAGFLLGGKAGLKKAFKHGFALFGLTILSCVLFCGHYLLRIEASAFWPVVLSRFLARGITTEVDISKLFSGYIDSFLYLWGLLILLLMFVALNCIRNKKIPFSLEKNVLAFLFAFPLIENVIMKEHAVVYTYDRMKGVFLLSFLICECANQLMTPEGRKGCTISILLVTCLAAGLNLKSSVSDSTYTWHTDYRTENQMLAAYINDNYPDSILCTDSVAVRGYINLLFMRGIYEWTNIDQAKEIASDEGKRYAIVLKAENDVGNVYDLTGATICDLQTGEVGQLTAENGNVSYSVA